MIGSSEKDYVTMLLLRHNVAKMLPECGNTEKFRFDFVAGNKNYVAGNKKCCWQQQQIKK